MSTLSIKIGGILDGSFSTTIANCTSHLSRLGKTIGEFNSSAKSISEYHKLRANTSKAAQSFLELRARATLLAKEMKATLKPTRSLISESKKISLAATRAKEAFLKEKSALNALNAEMRKSGGDINYLISNHSKLETSIGKVRNQYRMLGSILKMQERAKDTKSALKSELFGTVALGLGVAGPVKLSVDFESVMAEFKSVAKFNDKNEEINNEIVMAIGQKLQNLSREIPLSIADLAKIAIIGRRLGLSEEEIIQFTEAVGKMAVSFGMSAEELGSAARKLTNIYGLKAKDMKDLGNTLNHLAGNTVVNAKDMMSAILMVGSAAKQFGLTVAQTASLVNASISSGKSPEEAAETINNMLIKLKNFKKQGNEAREALEDLDIDVDELEKNIAKDPEGTLMQILEALNKIGKEESHDIISKIFGSGSKNIALMVENLQEYIKAKELLINQTEREKSLEEGFKDRASTTANKFQLLKNSIAEVSMNLGSVMLPTLQSVTEWLKWGSEGINSFAEKYPTATKLIMGTIATLISLKLGIIALGYVGSLLLSPILSFASKAFTAFSFLSTYALPAVISAIKGITATGAFTLLSSALSSVVMGLRAVTLAVINNPIGLLIAGLTAGAVYVITHWQKVKNFFASIWEYIQSIIKPVVEASRWIGKTVFGKVFENSPIKEFEKRESVVNLLNNSPVGKVFENSKNNIERVKIKSFVKEKDDQEDEDYDEKFKEFMKNKCKNREINKIQNITNNFSISIKAEPHHDIRSLAEEVIERLREEARGALFDIVEELD